jgi:hypothetical protein
MNSTGALATDTPAAARDRAAWPWRVAAALATLTAGAVLALVVAHWGWRWFGPAPAILPRADVPPPWSAVIAAAAPFGRPNAAAAGRAPETPVPTGAPAGDVRLLGVFAEPGGGGYGLFRLADRAPVLARSGQELSPGVKLEAVLPNGVRIRDHGQLRELQLRTAAAPREARPAGAPDAVRTPRNPACAPPTGFRGGIYRVNAELLTGVGAQADGWRAIVVADAGSLVVRDESGFTAMLGMRSGDRLTQANGIALAGIDDVMTAIVRPLVASQAVHLAGTRDGKAAEWLLLNAGACPP